MPSFLSVVVSWLAATSVLLGDRLSVAEVELPLDLMLCQVVLVTAVVVVFAFVIFAAVNATAVGAG